MSVKLYMEFIHNGNISFGIKYHCKAVFTLDNRIYSLYKNDVEFDEAQKIAEGATGLRYNNEIFEVVDVTLDITDDAREIWRVLRRMGWSEG